jgi:23S rRNA (uracil1939-C5)-methyltransferase
MKTKMKIKMQAKKPPVITGQIVELNITDLNHAAEGVGRVGDFAVFVPLSAPGDRVRARIISVQKNYARALLENVLESSSRRVPAPCRHFEDCGGCSLQHLKYDEQLRLKRETVVQALQRLGGLVTEVLPVLGMEEPWRYRNKSPFPLKMEGKELQAGFFRSRTHQIVNLEHCPIQHPLIEKAFHIARKLIWEMAIPVYDEERHKGLLRHLVVRASHFEGKVLVILVTNGREFKQSRSFAENLTSWLPELVGIVQNINTRRGNVIFGTDSVTLWGRDYLLEKLGHLLYAVSAGSFFQVNTPQAEILLRQVEKYAGLTGSETIFDLYCGAGTIALYLSRRAGKVVGIESYPPAVDDARKNAELNGISNAEFFSGLSETLFPDLIQKGYSPDVVIVDPPRKGCNQKLLSAIADVKPHRLIYVSCNPSTLARDLRYLHEQGYNALKVQPIDMFPHTAHVECIVQIKRAETRMG